ncbi:hypothetical protein Tco_0386311 [Tanacetum coccineum]
MGSNENKTNQDIIQDLKQQREQIVIYYNKQKEEYQKTQRFSIKRHNDSQAKIKDLENVVCKMGKSTETLWLLTKEQKAFRDNLCKSGLGYNGPCVLLQAYAKIPKLYRAYELRDENEQLHVFDSEDTLEDAERSRLKMNEFQKDEIFQALKIKPIIYGKMNKLYDDFVPQKELSGEQTYFSSSFISSEEYSSKTKPSMASLPSTNPMLGNLNEMEKYFKTLRNKDLHDETERISKESKDVSNESKTADTVCNDAFEVTQEFSKRIVELEKDISKYEAKSIAFEIALQPKS